MAERKRTPAIERFLAKVDKDGPVPEHRPDLGPCWRWKASTARNGYALFHSPEARHAHRWSYMHFVGPIPDGAELDHLCRNRSCSRPEHLEPVTHLVNLRRGRSFVNQQRLITHCPKGHAYDEQNTYLYRGMRMCRACRAEHTHKKDLERKALREQERVASQAVERCA